MGLSHSKFYRSRWQELLVTLNFQTNVMFYHRIHGAKWQRKELQPGQTSSCHRAPRHSSSGLAVTQQAPDTELKEISLTSKELCKGSASPIPLAALRRLSQLHMAFLADRPDPDPVYVCVGHRHLFLSLLLLPLLVYSVLPPLQIQAHTSLVKAAKLSRKLLCLDYLIILFFALGLRKIHCLAFLKASDKSTMNLHLNLTQTSFPLRTLKL